MADKDRKRSTWKSDDLHFAIKAVRDGKKKISTASKEYGIPRRTLRDYLQRNPVQADGNQNILKQKMGRKATLTADQENEVVRRVLRLSDLGFPITSKMLQTSVYAYCERNAIKHQFTKGIAGKDWLYEFLQRHPDVSRKRAQNLNEARAQKLNKFVVNDFFEKLEALMKEGDFFNHPERIFNIDEKGLRLCLHKSPLVLAKKGSKRVRIRGKEHGENVTCVACVSAIGSSIPPYIIFKGKNKKKEWGDDLPPGSDIAMSPKGSMTTSIFVEWLDHFAKYKPAGKCLIVMDGAKCHIDESIAAKAETIDVTLFCLPSNTTHELQPLDKSVFKPLETFWDQNVMKFWRGQSGNYDTTISKYRFAKIFTPSWLQAATPKNIVAGFSSCGIYPLDPSKIPEEAFAPSTVTESNDLSPPITNGIETNHSTQSVSTPSKSNDLSLPVTSRIETNNSAQSFSNPSSGSSTTMKEILSTPSVKAPKRSTRKAINSRAVVANKALFHNDESDADSNSDSESDFDWLDSPPPKPERTFKKKLAEKLKNLPNIAKNHKKISAKKTSMTSKKTLKKPVQKLLVKSSTTSTQSWFCHLCQADEIRDMRLCSKCKKYFHDDCMGLTQDDSETECNYCLNE